MTEFLKSLLFLNVQGSVIVILFLIMKKIIQRSFSGKAQRNLWIFVAVVFLLPIWKLVPAYKAAPIIIPYYDENFIYEAATDFVDITDRDFDAENDAKVTVYDAAWIWGVGITLFLLLNIASYIIFLFKKKNKSKYVTDELFADALLEMNIKRKIRLRECRDNESPMLTGVLFPVVYIPESELNETEKRYIYSHELTHFIHKDLLVKWFVCFINALHWFNPCVYFVMKNINEACELYCDEAVTKNMDDEGKKEYMNTILNLVKK